jgi:hypothetical protein
MGEERYWIIRGFISTRIHPDAGGRPSQRSRYVRRAARVGVGSSVDDLLASITAEARAHGNVALFRDHWDPRIWGDDGVRLNAEAGRLADDFRPRPLPAK